MKQNATFHDLAGKSVFITGGGSGIGAALTEGFLAQGAKVAFVQRSDASDFVQEMADSYGTAPLFLPCDITDIAALQTCLDDAAKAHGAVSVLVNNAANDSRHSLADTTVADWDTGMAVNLRPHFFTAQAAAGGMRQLGGGSIINFSSVSYMMGNAGYPGYVASKAGITGLTRALARELGPDNIRVNALMPGWVLTARQKELWATPEDLQAHLGRQCLKSHLEPEDIVDATLFLASESSKMMTGQAMVVDGGVVVTG
ncbi:NAD(P)-dependent dehydrogenase, short-chain alcohol dehydrogenase family [Thalassovita gelatinovora]|uniref:SDR family NAD(P)-dependent oxidoreductase n=1 Tax=Thalassovita gelatinovora TaxID=53501 RepID=UPI0008D6E2EE|nr:SDR family oxidoreductase [Thalassovita gelatinovora]QIZ82676.1 SDR family oxidoreductase [Thalassovita gelatinovora]SER11498.1 NAD(P)-dependent dehydrogenase, short-chain alcohol dehydrogenase family [Thalassovita gelatinovora]